MAFVPKDPNLEDEQGQGQEQPGVPPPAGESSALGTGAAPGGTAGGKATPQNRTASSSGFTNLKKYVDANQPQAEALGQRVKSNISQTIQGASDAANNADKGYSEKVNPNQYAFDAKSFDPAKQDKGQFQNLFTQNRAQFGAGGELDAANKAASDAKTKAEQIQTIGGRKDLLGQEQKLTRDQGMNTAGIRSFDNLLLQGSTGGKQAIENTAKELESAGLEAKLQSARARGEAIDAQARAKQAEGQAAARQALQGSAGALEGGIAKRLEDARTGVNARESSLLGLLGQGGSANLSAADMADLGVTPEQWAKVQEAATKNTSKGVFNDAGGLSRYIKRTGSSGDLTRADVTTADDMARSKALAELSGLAGENLSLSGIPGEAKAGNRDYMDLDIDTLLSDLSTPLEGVEFPDVFQRYVNVPTSGGRTLPGEEKKPISQYDLKKSAELIKELETKDPEAFNKKMWGSLGI